jgi:hemerythrin superfamily protein
MNSRHSGATMTILDDLKRDHDQLKQQLTQVLASADGKERSRLFKEFSTDLTAHSRAEEQVLYRALEKSEEGKSEALEGFVEHEVADRLGEDLGRARAVESDKWTARCTVLQEMLEHHITEEEGEVFKTARKLFDSATLETMAKAFAAAKAKHAAAAA